MKNNITLTIVLLFVVMFPIQVTADSSVLNTEDPMERQLDTALINSFSEKDLVFDEVTNSVPYWTKDFLLNDPGFSLPDVEYVDRERDIVEEDVGAGQGETHLSISPHEPFSDYRFIDFGNLTYWIDWEKTPTGR